MKKFMFCFLALVGLLMCACKPKISDAQKKDEPENISVVQLEKDLVKQYSECEKSGEDFNLHEELFDLLSKNPFSINHPFEKLQEVCDVYLAEPEDKQWRIYEIPYIKKEIYGEVIHGYYYILQYRATDGSIHLYESDDDMESEFHNINLNDCVYIVKDGGNKLYLLYYEYVNNEIENFGVIALKIEDDKVVFPKVFDMEGEKDYRYEVSIVSETWLRFIEENTPNEDCNNICGLFTYNKKNGVLTLPLATKDEYANYLYNGHFAEFKYDGKQFVKIGDKYPDYLNKSLIPYKDCLIELSTLGYYVRVDKLENGQLRYASWDGDLEMSDTPSLVIVGGKYDEDLGFFIFSNKGYDYWVTDGRDDTPPFRLSVRKNGETVVKQW